MDILEILKEAKDGPFWAEHSEVSKNNLGRAIDEIERLRTQAKRHEAEIAELVAMYRKAARHAILCPLMYGDDTPKNHCTCGLEATIAKYEVKR